MERFDSEPGFSAQAEADHLFTEELNFKINSYVLQ